MTDRAAGDGAGGDAQGTAEGVQEPWEALTALADLCNDLASQVSSHAQEIARLQAARPAGQPPKTATTPDSVEDADLRAWADQLAERYALRSVSGGPDTWLAIPSIRLELIGLMIADVRGMPLDQGSFELVYWHDALARVVERLGSHKQRLDNQTSHRERASSPIGARRP